LLASIAALRWRLSTKSAALLKARRKLFRQKD
jgi:hypothetical protein